MRRALLLLAVCLSFSSSASAADPFEGTLDYQSGVLSVADGTATIRAVKGFRYLAAGDAQRVLEERWKRPRDPGVLGLIVPPGIRVTDPDAFAAVVTYDATGHVPDAEAATLDDAKLLAAMPAVTGWAPAPSYDAPHHRLQWGERLRDGTLRYQARVLGREGTLALVVLAPADRNDAVVRSVRKILARTSFTAGNKYASFASARDRVSNNGIIGLIGGPAAVASAGAKHGLLDQLGLDLVIKAVLTLIAVVLATGIVLRRVRGDAVTAG